MSCSPGPSSALYETHHTFVRGKHQRRVVPDEAAIRRVVWFGLFCPAFASAQVGYLWTPAELVAESDVVLICEHVVTTPSGVKTSHPELKPSLPVIEVVSTLKVLAVLKGSSGPHVAVRHYWIDRERWGRGLVNTGRELRFDERRGPHLAFLVRTDDGRYTPTTGFTFPTTSMQRLVESGVEPTR